MAIAVSVLLVAIVAGSVLFHVLSPWWMTPIASNWGAIDGMVLVVGAGANVAGGLACGGVPAWRMARGRPGVLGAPAGRA